MIKHLEQHWKNKRGFTLIETLIYIALYSIIIGGAIVAVYTIFESAGRNQAEAMLEEEGMFLVGKLNWALSGTQIINTPAENATSSRLSITKYDDTTVVITLTATGTMMMIKNGWGPLPLNNTNTEVSGLSFVHTASSGGGIAPESVRASFTLKTRTSNGMTITQDFSTIGYIRK